ncbi:efflux RND transporter permease subunit, partial [Ochrobactrum sp. GRS2]|nr:efflux RND transporter permease subunit [Ochrobactrum sp. GRS2]
KQFGLTVAIAVLVSLAVARLLTPLMAAYMLQPHPVSGKAPGSSVLGRWYLGLLSWTLHHRKATFAMVAGIFAGSVY